MLHIFGKALRIFAWMLKISDPAGRPVLVGKYRDLLGLLLRTRNLTWGLSNAMAGLMTLQELGEADGADYIAQLFTEYTPLAGDRNFADDHAVMGGLARLDGRPVMVIGQEKGHDTQSRIERNFGMARPEGYRKAIRLMDLADRFNVPVITLVDTPGAYPGKGAEERGQSEAIARSTETCLRIGVPLVSVVIGEGGSGGAVAFATANRVAMLEHSVYSVISPEGCASILWKDAEKMREAAEQLRLTAQDLHKLGVIDRIIAEPAGGAQRDPKAAIKSVGACLEDMIDKLSGLSRQDIVRERRKKFLNMGSKGLAA